ncbi:Reticulon-like protein [Forsythia ovata]|uniref:Reticulon-like protein n=1 Tax=Forsythia ovata TaxID=205694 RepID=A0ABD1W4V1_9LAMI
MKALNCALFLIFSSEVKVGSSISAKHEGIMIITRIHLRPIIFPRFLIFPSSRGANEILDPTADAIDPIVRETHTKNKTPMSKKFLKMGSSDRLFSRQRTIHQILGRGLVADVMLWRQNNLTAGILVLTLAAWVVFEVSGIAPENDEEIMSAENSCSKSHEIHGAKG